MKQTRKQADSRRDKACDEIISNAALAIQRELGRDEGAAWAVAALVKSCGTGTESMELAEAWGMHRLLACADETDLPHIKKLIKDYPGRFRRVRAASRKGGE